MRKGTVPGRLTAQRKPHFGTHDIRPWTIDFVIGYYRDHVETCIKDLHIGFAPVVDFFPGIVAESVIIKVGGWKMRSVIRALRYHFAV